MSKKEFPSSRGQGKRHMGGKPHSFDMGYGAGSTVDRELNRLFGEFWEGTERSKTLQAQSNRKQLRHMDSESDF